MTPELDLQKRVKELEWLQSTEKLNAALALDSDSTVASCNCLTKTPDIQFHKIGCKYRLISERDQLRAELEQAKTLISCETIEALPGCINKAYEKQIEQLRAELASANTERDELRRALQRICNLTYENPMATMVSYGVAYQMRDIAKAALTESKKSDATPGSPAL